jgi:hypothetical protein
MVGWLVISPDRCHKTQNAVPALLSNLSVANYKRMEDEVRRRFREFAMDQMMSRCTIYDSLLDERDLKLGFFQPTGGCSVRGREVQERKETLLGRSLENSWAKPPNSSYCGCG